MPLVAMGDLGDMGGWFDSVVSVVTAPVRAATAVAGSVGSTFINAAGKLATAGVGAVGSVAGASVGAVGGALRATTSTALDIAHDVGQTIKPATPPLPPLAAPTSNLPMILAIGGGAVGLLVIVALVTRRSPQPT